MGHVANQWLVGGVDASQIADPLDRLCCYHMISFSWPLSIGITRPPARPVEGASAVTRMPLW